MQRCKASLREANSIASAAVTNAESATALTKKCEKREDDCKAQRNEYLAQRDQTRTERDHLAGENAVLKTDMVNLQLKYDDLKLRHDKEWSPTTWVGVGAGGVVVAWALLKFVVVPQLGLD